MKVVIIGPGALGCLIASSLAIKVDQPLRKSLDLELWLLDYRPERARLLNDNGLILEEGGRQKNCRIRTTATPKEIGPADIVLLCVKSQQMAEGLQQAAPLFQPESILLTLQNGIGHLDLLKDRQKLPPVVLGVTAQGANLVRAGHVRHAGDGLTRIGFPKQATFSRSLLLAKACNLLNYGGIETLIVDNIIDYVWSKLLINAGINALTAIERCPNGTLPELPGALEKMTAALREGEAVARALGIHLTDDPVTATLDVCRKTRENLSSMLQDVMHGRPTEIDSINGAIVAAGRKLDIATPINEELTQRVKKIEQTYSQGT